MQDFFNPYYGRGGVDLTIVKKSFFVTAMFVFALFSFTYLVYANEQKEAASAEITPFWAHTAAINANLNINNSGRAVMSGTVFGNPGTTHIVVNAVLYRVNPNGTTTSVVSFNNIRGEGNFWFWERPHYVARGHDYRFTMYATVFRNGTSETVSMSSRIVRAN